MAQLLAKCRESPVGRSEAALVGVGPPALFGVHRPAPLPALTKAVRALLSQVTQQSEDDALDGNNGTLEAVELVELVVTRLLKFTWDLKRDDVKDALDEMIAEADSSLNIRLQTHRPVRSRLSSLLSEMEKSWIIKVKVQESVEVEQKVAASPDWRHPTVAWLADYRNFQPALLPKLQLPHTNEGRVYENSDEYFTTIVNLWIGMTFIEGDNALLPHCTVKMGDKLCDQPLWPFPGKNTLMNCKNSHCDRSATFCVRTDNTLKVIAVNVLESTSSGCEAHRPRTRRRTSMMGLSHR